MPPTAGAPILVHDAPGLRDRHGAVHAGSFLRERRIAFDCRPSEFPRIFTHELFHFVWLRLGNARRRSWEQVVDCEVKGRIPGELGWSAEWRKARLTRRDREARTRRWREYCCESFCDTAAWLYACDAQHEEFNLGAAARKVRRHWFEANLSGGVSV